MVNHHQSHCFAQGQVFHCKLSILHSTFFSAFLFVSPYRPFIMMLSIIYLLLPRTVFLFAIPSRASFSWQFLHSQSPSQFLFLFFISSCIILPSPTLSNTTAFFILSVHFTRSILLHIHMLTVVFVHSVPAPYNATLHTKHFT